MDGQATCPRCRRENPAGDRFCGRCGAPLTSEAETGEIVPRRRGSSVTTAARRALPAGLKPVGKALAVGAAVLVAEACLSWLDRRDHRGRASPPGVARSSDEAAAPGRLVGEGLEEVLVLLGEGDAPGRRVLERRAVRWFYATETTDPRRQGAVSLPVPKR